jgi:Tfp pilus assembly protein PilZ
VEMKPVHVSFPSGRELLNAYWGLLANGGLVLYEPHGLSEGDRIALEVSILSAQKTYRLHGRVVRRPPQDASGRDRVVIAFDKGEPHDLLLSAAWAETENVPARRERRFPLDVDIRFKGAGGGELRGRLVNLSFSGCCLRVTRSGESGEVDVGEPLRLLSEDNELEGVVRWSNGSCRGIEFSTQDEGAVKLFLKQYL